MYEDEHEKGVSTLYKALVVVCSGILLVRKTAKYGNTYIFEGFLFIWMCEVEKDTWVGTFHKAWVLWVFIYGVTIYPMALLE